MSDGGVGLFGIYNNYLNYKNKKLQQGIQSEDYKNSLVQANNNLDITKEQAPLVPQQAADSFAARGVGQSTFGNGMGNEWGHNPSQPTYTVQPGTYAQEQASYQNAGPGANIGGIGSVPAPGAPTVRNGNSPGNVLTMTNGSGEGQGAGTGLQRARDLQSSMVSDASSQQQAAQNAFDEFQKIRHNTKRQYYYQLAEQIWGGALSGGMSL